MRKTSEEFNSEIMIKNVWMLCKEEPIVDELPYWETIWKKVKQSLEQKHRKLLESMKGTSLREYEEEMDRKIQIRII